MGPFVGTADQGDQGSLTLHGLSDGPGHTSRSEDENDPGLESLGSAVGLRRQTGQQSFGRGLVVGVISGEAGPLADQGVGRMRQGHAGVALLGQHRGVLLVGIDHTVAVDREGVELTDKAFQFPPRHPKRKIDRIETQAPQSGIVDHRAEIVSHRIADHPVDLGCSIDLFVVVNVSEVIEGRQAGSDAPFPVEGGIGKGRTILGSQNAAGQPEVAEAHRHRRPKIFFDQFQQCRLSAGCWARTASFTTSASCLHMRS